MECEVKPGIETVPKRSGFALGDLVGARYGILMISVWTRVCLVAVSLLLVDLAALFAAQPNERFVAGEILVSEVVGRLGVTSGEIIDRPIATGTALAQGVTLTTGAKSRAKFEFFDGTTVKAAQETEWGVVEFTVDPSAPIPEKGSLDVRSLARTKLRFEKGEIELKVMPLDFQRGARFQVETPAGIVSIRGTTFRLRLLPAGDAFNEFSVIVTEGMVVFFTKDGKVVEYVSPNRPYTVRIPR